MRAAWPGELVNVANARPLVIAGNRTFICMDSGAPIAEGFAVPVHLIQDHSAPAGGVPRSGGVFRSPQAMDDWATRAFVASHLTQAQYDRIRTLLAPFLERVTDDDVLPPERDWRTSDWRLTIDGYDREVAAARAVARERTEHKMTWASDIRGMLKGHKIASFYVTISPELGAYVVQRSPVDEAGDGAAEIKARCQIDRLPPDVHANDAEFEASVFAHSLPPRIKNRYTKKTRAPKTKGVKRAVEDPTSE